jgi:hypothetical protein
VNGLYAGLEGGRTWRLAEDAKIAKKTDIEPQIDADYADFVIRRVRTPSPAAEWTRLPAQIGERFTPSKLNHHRHGNRFICVQHVDDEFE